MHYLFLAIASSALISILMRLSKRHTRSAMAMLAMNYLMCCLLGMAHTGSMQLFPRTEGLGLALILGALGGILYFGGFVLMQWNISRNGVVLPATFIKLGVIVPTALSIIVFGETPRLTQLIGMAAAICAIFLIQEKGEKGAGSVLGLVLLMLFGGGGDAMSKVFEEIAPAELKNQFLLYIFIAALALCLLLCLVQRQRIGLGDVLFGLAIGIPNYYSARFLLLALGEIPAMVAYPCYSVGTIIVVAVVGAIAFREKLGRRKLIALSVILAALVLLNI